MLLAMLCFSFMNNCVRQASLELHSTQIAMIRNIVAMLFMLTWILCLHPPKMLKTKWPKRHLLRACLGIGSIELWFYGLSKMPLNEATALSFTTPLFVSLFAILFLKEHSTLARWGAIAIGFAGTLVILRPELNNTSHIALMVLGSAAIIAASSILVKTMTRADHPDTIVFYQGLFMAPLSIPFALWHGGEYSLAGIGWSVAVAISSVIAHLLVTRAFLRCDMTVLMPFDFSRLIFTALMAYFWFGETLDNWTLLGGVLITFGSVWGATEGNNDIRLRIRRLLSFWRSL